MESSARHTTEFRNWVLCLLPANRLLASIHLLSNSLHKKTTHYTQHPMSSDPPTQSPYRSTVSKASWDCKLIPFFILHNGHYWHLETSTWQLWITGQMSSMSLSVLICEVNEGNNNWLGFSSVFSEKSYEEHLALCLAYSKHLKLALDGAHFSALCLSLFLVCQCFT